MVFIHKSLIHLLRVTCLQGTTRKIDLNNWNSLGVLQAANHHANIYLMAIFGRRTCNSESFQLLLTNFSTMCYEGPKIEVIVVLEGLMG